MGSSDQDVLLLEHRLLDRFRLARIVAFPACCNGATGKIAQKPSQIWRNGPLPDRCHCGRVSGISLIIIRGHFRAGPFFVLVRLFVLVRFFVLARFKTSVTS